MPQPTTVQSLSDDEGPPDPRASSTSDEDEDEELSRTHFQRMATSTSTEWRRWTNHLRQCTQYIVRRTTTTLLLVDARARALAYATLVRPATRARMAYHRTTPHHTAPNYNAWHTTTTRTTVREEERM